MRDSTFPEFSSVRIKRDVWSMGRHAPAGSVGTIVDVHPTQELYQVEFDLEPALTVTAHVSDLEPVK